MSENEYAREMECDFDAAIEGAYYAEQIAKARRSGRIGFVAEDPHLVVRLFADIGGTGAKADNFVFWAQQCVGTEIRWTDHDEEKTRAGVDALVAYHEKRDEKRGIGLGPNHDWASHSADAFGAGCVAYEEPTGAEVPVFGTNGGWAG
jgi:hypothetical protein